MRKLAFIGGIILAVMLFTAGVLAYFIHVQDPMTHIIYDGFGRPLSETPLWLQWLFWKDRLWPGWQWFVVDMIVFWTGLISTYLLIEYSKTPKS